jgi:hypothetical protein
MLKLDAAVLTADRIDSWIRRHVIQYYCETHPSQQKWIPTFVKTSVHGIQVGIDEQMLGSE